MTGAVIQAQPHIPVPLTPEQIEEEQRQAETWRAQQAERERVQVEADATALELLESTLTPQQREDFLKDNAFFVVSKSGKVYQIRKGRQQNIYEMDANRKLVKKYCVVPQESDIPTGDILLMQKLLIEHAEDEFLRKANSWAM